MHHSMPPCNHSIVRGIVGGCLVAVAIGNHDATAQTLLDKWPKLTATRLQTVYVQDETGHEEHGRLLGFTPEALFVIVDGSERRFDRAAITKVQTRDSLKNGAWTGAVVGAVLSAIGAGLSDCPGDAPGGACPGLRLGTFVAGVGVYTAVGTALDAAIRGHSTLYEAPIAARLSQAGTPGPRPLLRIRASW